MRIAIACIVVAVCGVAFVTHERKSALEHRLGNVATELGGRHVRVHCQSFAGNLVDVSAEAGSVRFDASGIPSDTTDLKRPVCQALSRFAADASSAGYACVLGGGDCPERYWEDVLAVHTLAHEVWHLHGIGSEAVAECDALQTTARAASLLGAGAGGRTGDRGVRPHTSLSTRAGRVPAARMRQRRPVRPPARRPGLALARLDAAGGRTYASWRSRPRPEEVRVVMPELSASSAVSAD